MVVLNPNNWHWVDKNTLPWTKDYLNEKLLIFSKATDDNTKLIKIVEISKIEGDSNVSQRKGKPICYFDLHVDISLEVLGRNEEDEEEEKQLGKGSLVIPEFMHDEDNFEIKLNGFTSDLKEVIQATFLPSFTEVLLNYQNDLIKSHSSDLQQK
ncbi:Hch1p NDAI_0A05990 [Naumovozyma dairenensis CBS 421]|uniref:Activator of Hsp90 ATPase AHSA1-like N-terminal domain-containing protein n=1 Tax=Naumovozyma dairenensis (strain ATCC 10597 / BCRC 20456 / CBS 421 / NBRC 0211 / NRRL Y-12639) TaxID=1071378 RepID=G0W4L6_NAUDC|nr:hypothetical protein NDAI_0A05990 [Naumovozyma dairenensis CBS 421]CCD22754.1 hypothetical protein NDAI_0A05990 [Naumovozyma dairenensis CBS 421]